jgi:hypothetical protein
MTLSLTSRAGKGAPLSAIDHDDNLDKLETAILAVTPGAFGTITYAATVDLDGAELNGKLNTISLTGALTFTTSELASGQEIRLRLVCDSTTRALTFPVDWVFFTAEPTEITADKEAILSLAVFGATNADVRAVYLEQE